MLLDYFKFAWNSLANKKLRSWLTLLGIFVGVAAVVSLIGLGEGLQVAISSQFGMSATEVITVQAGGISMGPPGSGVVNPLTQKDADDIERITSVDFAIPRIIEQVKIEYNDKTTFGFATNTPDGEKRKFVYDVADLKIESGRLLRDGDRRQINLGYNFGKEDNTFGKAITPGKTIIVNDERFEVVGIFERTGSFINDNILILNEDALKSIMENPNRIDLIAVKIRNKDLMENAANSIERVLRRNRNVREEEEDFSVQTPEAALSQINNILGGVQAFIILIASISILVGAVGIVNTMTTSVLERKQQIGIMKAIGAKNSDIFFQFLIESGMMGLLGGIIGAIIGQTISYYGTLGINSFIGSSMSPQINFMLIIFTLAGTFLIGCIAGTIPAIQAARQKPVDSLRG